MATDSRVKVFARFRPTKKLCKLLDIEDKTITVKENPSREEERFSKATGVSYDFKFAKVFDCLGQQEELFETVSKPIAARFLDGYNGTIFAYGQTGSGKTYTVEGSARRYKDRGMIPRVISYIYKALENRGDGEEWKIEMSFMEIYQDVGYDLLNPGSQGQSMMVKLPRVKVIDSSHKGISVKNLSLHLAANEEVAHSLLFQGSANRKVAETSMNLQSSRSHAIFSILLTVKSPDSDVVTKSKLNLVDLAGSERVAKTRADGRVLNEAKHINLSLHHLEHVIVALHQQSKGRGTSSPSVNTSPHGTPATGTSRGGVHSNSSPGISRYTSGLSLSSSRHRPHTRTHVPYRNCLLTMVLKDSLGGNCYTAMVATLSGEESNLGETISTCRFAQRVSCIANVVRRNEEVDDKVMIKRLKQRIAELEAEVELLQQGILTANGQQQQQQQQHQQEEAERHHHQCTQHQVTSSPLSDGERKHCHQILYSYLHGKLEDPIQAGVDSSGKVQECLKVMKDIVLHALGIEKQGRDEMATPKSNTPQQKQISPESSVSRKHMLTATPPPSSRISSGFGSIGEEEGSRDISPLQQSHASHMTSNTTQTLQHSVPGSPHVITGVDRKQEVTPRKQEVTSWKSPSVAAYIPQQMSSPASRDREGEGDRESRRSNKAARRTTSKDTAAMEAKMAHLAQSEEEKRRLQMNVQQLQIKVKEEEIRSELDLIKEQLAVQHARILSLQQKNAEDEVLCQERLAEQQLRVKQAKLHQQLLYIEHTLKVHNMVDVPRPEESLKGPKSPQSPSRKSLEKQLMTEVATHSKQQSKMDEQIEKLRKSQVEKSLELREAATRRKLLALKQQFTAAQTSSYYPPAASPPLATTLPPSSQETHTPHGPPTPHSRVMTSGSVTASVSTSATPGASKSNTPVCKELRHSPAMPVSSPGEPVQSNKSRDVANTSALSSVPTPTHSTSHNRSIGDTPPHSSSHSRSIGDTPTHSSSHSRSTGDTPTHSTSCTRSTGGTPTHSSSRDGLASLRERLQVTSPPARQTGKSPTVAVLKDEPTTHQRQLVTIPEEKKEMQFMSQGQQHLDRVSRIRRAMAAATVIQRAWRRHRARHTS